MSCEATPTCCNSTACNIFPSQIENEIINAEDPIDVVESEQINVNGEIGIWINKAESEAFTGPIPINKYPINRDPAPQVLHKKPKCVECHRDVTIKYLEPPSIPVPGPIYINQAQNILAPPAPPVIIRQVPCNPIEPETLVIREVPPRLPNPPSEKSITIPGEMLPPPPRKLVIERLPELPDKPQDIHIERWLPFKDIKRQVILNPKPSDPVVTKPKNVIINWGKRNCSQINTDIINLGVEKADPLIYAQTHANSLSSEDQMPEICDEVKREHGIPLAVDQSESSFYKELEGDIHALQLIDLDAEGLSEYKKYLSTCENCDQCTNHEQIEAAAAAAGVVSSDQSNNLQNESQEKIFDEPILDSTAKNLTVVIEENVSETSNLTETPILPNQDSKFLTVDIPKNEENIMNVIKEEPVIELEPEVVVKSPKEEVQQSIEPPATFEASSSCAVEEPKTPVLEKSLVYTNLKQKSQGAISEDFSAYVQSQVEELSNFSVVIDTPVASYETSIIVDSSQLEQTVAEPVPTHQQQQDIIQSVLDQTLEIEETTVQEPFLNVKSSTDPLESIYSESQSFAVALDEYSQVSMTETEKKTE